MGYLIRRSCLISSFHQKLISSNSFVIRCKCAMCMTAENMFAIETVGLPVLSPESGSIVHTTQCSVYYTTGLRTEWLFLKTVQVYSSDNNNLLMLRLLHPLFESSASNLLLMYSFDRCKLLIKILSSSLNAERHVLMMFTNIAVTCE